MRTMTKWVPGILMAGALALAGCGKPTAEVSPQMEINGVKLDVPRLQQAFATEKPDLQSGVNKATMAIRYGQNAEALAELEKLAANASLTEPEKKAVNDVIGQVKQLMAKAAK